MRNNRKILAWKMIYLFLFFTILPLFGCKFAFLKGDPEFRTIYNKTFDKTYNIPFECPDPYDEKAMKGYKATVQPLNPSMPMLIYYKVDKQGRFSKDSPMYGLVFDKFNKEIIAVCIIVLEKNIGLKLKYWIYKDGKYPSPCTALEQEEWLSEYLMNKANRI